MLSYLLFRGMDLSTVGILRGVSSAIGLSGTCIFQLSMYYTNSSLPLTGMWSILYQFVCISLSAISMFISNYNTSMILFIIGVCASRIGLFVYEITVIQLMQEHIPESIRGNIGGTQNSLNAFFQLSSFALCLIYSNPKDFVIVVMAGYIAVGIASLFFGFGIYKHKVKFESRTNNNDKNNNDSNSNGNGKTNQSNSNNSIINNDNASDSDSTSTDDLYSNNNDDLYGSNNAHELTVYFNN
jgi:solute carrier family 40 (iron-regulated transporter), member 1